MAPGEKKANRPHPALKASIKDPAIPLEAIIDGKKGLTYGAEANGGQKRPASKAAKEEAAKANKKAKKTPTATTTTTTTTTTTATTTTKAKAQTQPQPQSHSQAKGKGKGKSPLTAKKPVVEEEEEEDSEDAAGDKSEEGVDSEGVDSEGMDSEGMDSEEEAEMLKGMTSGSDDSDDDDADSSDEEDEDDEQVKKHMEFETLKLKSSKDDKAVAARLEALQGRRKAEAARAAKGSGSGGSGATKTAATATATATAPTVKTATLFVGHLPRLFTEGPLRAYFSQFGSITRLRLSRNKKTGASKHYAFIEFADEEVARIVQETMDSYLILNQLLRVRLLERDEVHPKLWVGANRAFRKVPQGTRARVQHDGPKSEEHKGKVEKKLLQRQEDKKKALKEAGIEYEFEGYGRQS